MYTKIKPNETTHLDYIKNSFSVKYYWIYTGKNGCLSYIQQFLVHQNS